MATYVNDLRLKEIGTGESSGTWGTETNVNLELIGEALGYGTEAITTNADTHTTTVADGSTDPGRAMYIKYTGTLDSACTITIGPNTINRLHYIENATSGSQNIIISQGSGANITIPAGDTKAVYLDGAGSGAAVVDVFASFSTVDLKVQDDLTVTDDATIGGTLGVTGILTCTDDIIIGDGKTIGSASDVDAMTIASNGQVTFTQTLIGTALDISGDIDVDGTANLDVVDIDGAVDMASTLAVGGVVTANAGVVVDNITIDGTEIDLSSGNFLLDVAGNIQFDTDTGVIYLQDAGTTWLQVNRATNDAEFYSAISDGDIVFKGNDASSTVTALTLDMSEAGAATFNSSVQATSGDLRNTSSGAQTTALSLRNFAAGANTATALNFFPTQSTSRFASIISENTDGNNNITLDFHVCSGDTPTSALLLNQDRTATFSGNVTVPNLLVADDITHSGDADTYISFETNARTDYAGGTRLIDLNAGGITLNEGGGGVDIRMESSNLTHNFFSDASEDVVLLGSATGTVNSGFDTLPTTIGGVQIAHPGIDDNGGHMFMSFVAEQDTYKTFLSIHDVGATGVTFLLNATRTIDQNRHRSTLVRYAYNQAFTALVTSEQNTTIDFRVDGTNLQLRFTSAGDYMCNLIVMAAG
jgi:hypothetical protein